MSFNIDDFSESASKHNRVVVYEEIEGDLDTPISILGRLLRNKQVFLLESAKSNKTYSRFSFLSFDISDVYTLLDDGLYLNGTRIGDFTYLQTIIDENKTQSSQIGDFNGGFVGYFSFDFVSKTNVLKKPLQKRQKVLAKLFFVEHFLVYDNYTNRLYVGLSQRIDRDRSISANYALTKEKIARIKDMIDNSVELNIYKANDVKVINKGFSKIEFETAVKQIKQLIEDGEAIQVVLSNFYDVSGINPFLFYRQLRRINPSPYMYFFKDGDELIVGSSPEIHVKKRGNMAIIKPIAGTKPKGDANGESKKNIQTLLNDKKEKSEHLMLVDLARNDLSTVAKVGTLNVKNFMRPESYSHVIHLVSHVEAQLDDGYKELDLLLSTFPAGTLSGAPKSRAIEIIDEFEKLPRGPYGGCIGYIGFNGNIDMAITIRSAVFDKAKARLQAGAGIVYESNPESEYYETINKLGALIKAGGLHDYFD